MDSTLSHEALSRFDQLEERLKAVEKHLFGKDEDEETSGTEVPALPESTPEEPEETEHTEV